ncbi:AI-2E family transporter [Methanosarcina horonobensis]|uniref:AI-2E family transporter n=1 Tax=Methanosarcina horonobensis TaxID=418008 RepID=UPI000B281431|nr:AI-2E family transporter [Methanosarcina horonobensis]
MSWLFLGILLAASTILSIITTVSGIIVPLLVAVVIGIVFRPLVDMLERRHVQRNTGTVLTMFLIFLGAAILFMVLVRGFIDQGAEIVRQLNAGWASLRHGYCSSRYKQCTAYRRREFLRRTKRFGYTGQKENIEWQKTQEDLTKPESWPK